MIYDLVRAGSTAHRGSITKHSSTANLEEGSQRQACAVQLQPQKGVHRESQSGPPIWVARWQILSQSET